MSCDECAKIINNNKISIFFQNNKDVKTTICKSCETWCQPNCMYCILCANRLGLCQKCGKTIFDSSKYKYSDIKWKDYLRKRRASKISIQINERLIKKKRLDKLRPKDEKPKKKNPMKIKVTNYSFGNNNENNDKDIEINENIVGSKNKKDGQKKKDEEIKFFEEKNE